MHINLEGETYYDPDDLVAIEFGQAWEIFHERRLLYSSKKCEPLVTKLQVLPCNCAFRSHFIGNRWLCISCFNVETPNGWPQS